MTWQIKGADRNTGVEREITIEADDETAAIKMAAISGLFVETVKKNNGSLFSGTAANETLPADTIPPRKILGILLKYCAAIIGGLVVAVLIGFTIYSQRRIPLKFDQFMEALGDTFKSETSDTEMNGAVEMRGTDPAGDILAVTKTPSGIVTIATLWIVSGDLSQATFFTTDSIECKEKRFVAERFAMNCGLFSTEQEAKDWVKGAVSDVENHSATPIFKTPSGRIDASFDNGDIAIHFQARR